MNIQTIIASFLSGMLSAMGFGGGSVLLIYLTVFLSVEQKQAQGINLIFFILTGIFALISNKRKGYIDKKAFFSFIPLSVIGLIIGYIFLNFVSPFALKKTFGVLLVSLGLFSLISKKK